MFVVGWVLREDFEVLLESCWGEGEDGYIGCYGYMGCYGWLGYLGSWIICWEIW